MDFRGLSWWWVVVLLVNGPTYSEIGFRSYPRSPMPDLRFVGRIGWANVWHDSLPPSPDSLSLSPSSHFTDTLAAPLGDSIPTGASLFGGYISPLTSLSLIQSTYDTMTNYVLWKYSTFRGLTLSAAGELGDYLRWKEALSDASAWRKTVGTLFGGKTQQKGSALSIQIPVFRSKEARRIFGGSDVGLSVAGSITIEGGLMAERRNEIARGQSSPVNYALKINQKQQFNIKGKVGEKVSVEVDQDSEKLFEFENSLKIRYKGDDDEIVKSVEAGNVDLNLRGSSLVSSSTQHKGLFGFKTQSQFGPLTLTAVASLDKGEKNEIEITAGARTARPVRILPTSYVQYRYYFLDYNYRENYRYFDENLNHVVTSLAPEILDIQVYRSVIIRPGENENAVPGWAFADPNEQYQPGFQPDNRRVRANWLPLSPEADYFINRQLGYIRLTRPIDNQTALAVAYRTTQGVVGDLDPSDNSEENPFILKLLQPPNPQPSDPTWDLMWRHVYDLGSANIDEENFQCRILFRSSDIPGEGQEVGIDATGRQRSYLAIFGLDQFSPSGPGEDGKVDGKFLNIPWGELHFPDLKPFDPKGWYKVVGGGTPELQPILLNPSERDSLVYVTPPSQLYTVRSDFIIEVVYAASSATFDLGFGVLEGSEEVILNGQRLSRGQDYSIDYFSGQLTILRREALSPGADLKIRYEKGQLFQLDTKTMLGIRGDYDLGKDNFIGGTLLYLNQRTLDQRVRVGGEPLRNTVWGLNSKMSFEVPLLTRLIDALPLIRSEDRSSVTFQGEVAQVLPDPNSLNSPSTGDFNGVAYIDDFEAIKRSTPLGLTRRQWSLASFPLYDSRGGGRWLRQRGRVIWYEPEP
ncbi:MAG: cell surface protein SprA, partial [bacterium]